MSSKKGEATAMRESRSEGSNARRPAPFRTIPERSDEMMSSGSVDAREGLVTEPLLGGPDVERGISSKARRRRCCGIGSREKDEDRECFAPLTDMPSNDPNVGPHFRFEVDEMMRTVYEGKGVRKIARYREQRLVRFGWLSPKIWHTTYLASGYCWVQILLLWLAAALVACFVYAILFSVNAKTIESLQTGLKISDTLRTLAAFVLGFYLEKTINIWYENDCLGFPFLFSLSLNLTHQFFFSGGPCVTTPCSS